MSCPFVPSRPVCFAALVAVVVAAPLAASGAPQSAPASRPRIGLALGGGSARGFAQVGVLQWLTEHRIPIDAVAGTSIGGVIGGSYAAGMTADEIAALVRNTDWSLMFTADSPFEYKTVRRKQDRRAYPMPLELGLKNGVSLPRSLNPAQRIELLVDRIALPYPLLDSFDDLPTPYRCVAFDLNSARSIVLDKGALAQAMRATMSLPGIFPPVEIDRQVLIDGGILDNVPADVARRMQVDVVIAVDVGSDPAADQRVSILSILSRTITAEMAAGARASLASADVVLTPDLDGLTSISWHRHEEARVRGYRTAEAHAAELLKYALDASSYQAYEAARRARRPAADPVPVSVIVTGVPEREQRIIARELARNIGRPLDPDRVADDVLRVTGTDRYERVSYSVAPGPTGPALVVGVRPRSNGPPFVAMGLEANNVDASNFALSAAARTTIDGAAGAGSEVRLDVVVGTRLGASAEIYRPLGASKLFVAPRIYATRGTRDTFLDGRLVAESNVARLGGGLDIGFATTHRTEVRVGFDAAKGSEHVRAGTSPLPEADGAERFASVQVTFDGQDSVVVPTGGAYVRARARRFFDAPATPARPDSPRAFWQAEADVIAFQRVGRRNRLFLRLAGGTSFDARPFFDDFSLGGPFRMSAYGNDELRGAHYALAGIGYVRQAWRLPAVAGSHAYVAGWMEAGSAFQARSDAAWHGDAAAGLILDSLVGPVFIGGSVGPGGHRRVYVALGPLFR